MHIIINAYYVSFLGYFFYNKNQLYFIIHNSVQVESIFGWILILYKLQGSFVKVAKHIFLLIWPFDLIYIYLDIHVSLCNHSKYAVNKFYSLHLTNKCKISITRSVVPEPVIRFKNGNTVLGMPRIVWFTRIPVSYCNSRQIVPNVLTLNKYVSSSNVIVICIICKNKYRVRKIKGKGNPVLYWEIFHRISNDEGKYFSKLSLVKMEAFLRCKLIETDLNVKYHPLNTPYINLGLKIII